jgi:hypothetical protein
MPRHLPILQTRSPSGAAEEAGATRPPWQWAAIGAVMAVALWAPLAMIASALGASGLKSLLGATTPEEVDTWIGSASTVDRIRFWVLLAGLPAAAFALACLLSGVLVGRFGSGRGVREAAAAGLITALFGWVITLIGGTSLAGALAALVGTSAIGAGAGALGAVIGRKLAHDRQNARGGSRTE